MQIYTFSQSNGRRVTQFDSNFIMSHIVQTDQPAQVCCMYLEKNSVIGYHQAVVPQLLLIVTGEGFVRSGEESFVPVQAGEAVFWGEDEWHETKTDQGLTAIVIESDGLDPGAMMSLKK
ncbi:hypothetical protein JNUCC1_01454 [Lentibacillus sp. JNUCC-1]|uniref:cupin domain-containing protein n=1 Tax=Lentibacillus sp. JNUCC-1 TaxID=2654513 RepID=UPI001323A392|nr:hypothetical protein [Lentibacillus sp. JNUCC-1]